MRTGLNMMRGKHGVVLLAAMAVVAGSCARQGTRWVTSPSNNQDAAVQQDAGELLSQDLPGDLGPKDVRLDLADAHNDAVLADTPDTDVVQVLDQLGPDIADLQDLLDLNDLTLDGADAESDADASEPFPDIELDIPNTWLGVGVLSATAPDDSHVVVLFDAAPQDSMALADLSIEIGSDFGPLGVSGADWDLPSLTLTLTTKRQKLGVTYTLAIGSAQATNGLLQADFIAADTKVFWTTDFNDPDMDDIQVSAHRIFVGEHVVAYTMDGYDFEGAEASVQEFDSIIYPTLTEALFQPQDFDGNGRIVLLFTDSDGYGGYFTPINQFPGFVALMNGLKSNEMELLYISGWTSPGHYAQIEAHEFQHLLYYCRHLMKDFVHWDFHDEGMAESAVKIVYGANDMATGYYQYDPQDIISNGASLVKWEWGVYEHYSIAYVFWAWVAGQLGGVEAYKLIFEIEYGGPEQVSAFLQENLGMDLHQAVQAMMAAVRIQAPSGLYSFNGMIALDPNGGPSVPDGVTTLQLEPFGGAFFPAGTTEIAAPADSGPHVAFSGITVEGLVDQEAPYNTSGGWLVAYNGNWDYDAWLPESTGTIGGSVQPLVPRNRAVTGRPQTSEAWSNPPPRNPMRPEEWRLWREATLRSGHH